MLLAATQAALPAGLLAALGADARDAARRSAGAQGREGQRRQSRLRGRPIGTRAGTLRDGARLSIVETLRSAAPWQPLRLRERAGRPLSAGPGPRILVKRDDIRLMRFQQHTETTAIFVVDASGSAALHRLAEAKGAVEMLLADCYVRRDRVAVIAFRGQAAEMLLPPTNSLVRAKRSLAGLPGGGATPLALGLDAAMALAEEERRRGRTPLVILLTDGRANISRAGTPGRPQAEADALAAAIPFRLAGLPALLVDTAPRPAPFAKQMATAMGARYLALPAANSERLSAAVTATRGAA
jgi:magnesium chelatase subunit D